jgi:hypothetical protein
LTHGRFCGIIDIPQYCLNTNNKIEVVYMIVKIAITHETRNKYNLAKAGELVQLSKTTEIKPVDTDDIMNSPSMERFAKSLAKLYIEMNGMK